MKKIKILMFFSAILLPLFILHSPEGYAEEIEYQIASYIVRSEYVLVPDVDKHAIGLYERRGVALLSEGETAAYHTRGTFDFIDYNGQFQGYSTMTYKDGSMTIVRYSGTMKKESGKLPTYSGKGEFIKGTGKFEGIEGTTSFNAQYITPYSKETKGDVVVTAKSSYTLPE